MFTCKIHADNITSRNDSYTTINVMEKFLSNILKKLLKNNKEFKKLFYHTFFFLQKCRFRLDSKSTMLSLILWWIPFLFPFHKYPKLHISMQIKKCNRNNQQQRKVRVLFEGHMFVVSRFTYSHFVLFISTF